MNEIRTKI